MTKKVLNEQISVVKRAASVFLILSLLVFLFGTVSVYGAIWDTFVISVEQPHVGYYMNMPNV